MNNEAPCSETKATVSPQNQQVVIDIISSADENNDVKSNTEGSVAKTNQDVSSLCDREVKLSTDRTKDETGLASSETSLRAKHKSFTLPTDKNQNITVNSGMTSQRNSKPLLRLLHSPSDPAIGILRCRDQIQSQCHERSKSLSYLGGILTDKLKLEAFRNLQRRSVEPEVFIFPSRPYIPLPRSNNNAEIGHVNNGFSNSYNSIVKQDKVAQRQTRLSRISSSHETNSCFSDNCVTSPERSSHSDHLLYGGKGTNGTVKIDYDTIFYEHEQSKQHYEKQSPQKTARSLSIGEKAFRKMVRQVSRNKLDYQPNHAMHDGSIPPPRNYFDLALFTCCCCISPLGLVALFFSVRTDTAYQVGATRKAERYSHVTLLLSLLGIGVTLSLSLIILVTKFYVYDDTVSAGVRMRGGT